MDKDPVPIPTSSETTVSETVVEHDTQPNPLPVDENPPSIFNLSEVPATEDTDEEQSISESESISEDKNEEPQQNPPTDENGIPVLTHSEVVAVVDNIVEYMEQGNVTNQYVAETDNSEQLPEQNENENEEDDINPINPTISAKQIPTTGRSSELKRCSPTPPDRRIQSTQDTEVCNTCSINPEDCKKPKKPSKLRIILRHLLSALTFGTGVAILVFFVKSLFYAIFLKVGPPFFGLIFLWSFLGFGIFYVFRHLGACVVAITRRRPLPSFFFIPSENCDCPDEGLTWDMNRARGNEEARHRQFYKIQKTLANVRHELNDDFEGVEKDLDCTKPVPNANNSIQQQTLNGNNGTDFPYKISEQTDSYSNFISKSAPKMTRAKIMAKFKNDDPQRDYCEVIEEQKLADEEELQEIHDAKCQAKREKEEMIQSRKYRMQFCCYKNPLFLPKPKVSKHECKCQHAEIDNSSSDDDANDGFLYDVLQIPSRRRKTFTQSPLADEILSVRDPDIARNDPCMSGDAGNDQQRFQWTEGMPDVFRIKRAELFLVR